MADGKKNIKPKSKGNQGRQTQVRKNVYNPPVKNSTGLLSHPYFIPVLLFVLSILLYGSTFFYDYTLDDGLVTTQNSFIVKGFSALKDIFDKGSLYGWDKTTYVQQYRPLTLLSFMVESSIFGLNPHVGHFINVLLFAFTIVVLYFFLRKIMRNYNQAIIIASTLLFAFHPLHTEVVASIKSRDEILTLLLGLLSFYFMMLNQEENKKSYLFISLASFFAALFCKESALTFVAIIPILLYFFTSLEIKKVILKSLPYLLLAAIYLFIRSRVLSSMTFENQIGLMDNSLMSTNNSADRMATCFAMLGKYMFMNIVPYPLSYDYSYNQIPIVSWGTIKPILTVLVCIALIVYMCWGATKKSIFSFSIALFFITIIISSNIVVKIAASFAERFLYVPSLSFCIALPILIASAFKLNPQQLVWKKSTNFYVPILIILIIYAIIVIPRNGVWKNNYTLFSSGVVTAPNSARAHRFLEFQFADSALKSKDSARMLHYYSLAINETRRALEIDNNAPDWFTDMGEYYKSAGKRDSAIYAFKKALGLNPKYATAANSLGAIYFNKTIYDSALKYFLISYNTDNNLDALQNIGISYLYLHNYPPAFHYDSLYLQRVPGNRQALNILCQMHSDIAIQYLNNNELDRALQELQSGLVCDTNSAIIIGNMAIVYQKKGDIEKAKYYYQKALSKDPQNQLFKNNLQALEGKH